MKEEAQFPTPTTPTRTFCDRRATSIRFDSRGARPPGGIERETRAARQGRRPFRAPPIPAGERADQTFVPPRYHRAAAPSEELPAQIPTDSLDHRGPIPRPRLPEQPHRRVPRRV